MQNTEKNVLCIENVTNLFSPKFVFLVGKKFRNSAEKKWKKKSKIFYIFNISNFILIPFWQKWQLADALNE